jgi:hypothetical protein
MIKVLRSLIVGPLQDYAPRLRKNWRESVTQPLRRVSTWRSSLI